jgi:hypothetical protein
VREFWVSSGHHLARRSEGGGLLVTDELLLAWLARPELLPPEDACAAERALHAALLADPRRPVRSEEVSALADADARENWALLLAFRDRLLAAPTLEAAYLDLARRGAAGLPPLFLNQLVHLILRNALEGYEDPFVLRAAELFFRPQRVSTHEGRVLMADAEVIEAHEGQPSPLLAMLGKEPATELDVLDDGNAWTYWSRSDAHGMALDWSAPRSRDGLARAMEAFIAHLLPVEARIEPAEVIVDRDWRWFVGLDAEATRIGNALWRGEEVGEDAKGRTLGLFRLRFDPGAPVDPQVAGHPVYLLLAVTADRTLRMKPQNLVVGLPLAAGARAT